MEIETIDNVDGFRDLVNGKIDIVSYLGSASGSGQSLSNLGVLDEEVFERSAKMLNTQDLINQNLFNKQMQQTTIHLPESPPETDSASAHSSTSPNSEQSSCSPSRGYVQQPPQQPHQQHHSGVIHPNPVLGNGLTRHSTSTIHHLPNGNQAGGLILSVPELGDFSAAAAVAHLNSQQQRLTSLSNAATNNSTSTFSPNGYTTIATATPSTPQQCSPTYTVQNGALVDALSPVAKKRLRSDEYVKGEPTAQGDLSMLETASLYGDSLDGFTHQAIRFNEFQRESWNALCDQHGRELNPLGFHVIADKGFNYSPNDQAFINQKKNHFQVTVHIQVHDRSPPKFLKIQCEGGPRLMAISEFQLDFFGVKHEMPTSKIMIKQSQSDRKPVIYEPVGLDLPPGKEIKVTVQRLHFSETTLNNQRKNGRPNPDQKYFQLLVSLNAVGTDGCRYTVQQHGSERVIVRASNPGQFDSGETDMLWQRGATPGSICYQGPVGIGTSQPQAALHVHGDAHIVGKLTNPSDRRLKQNIEDVNTTDALDRMAQMRIVKYEFKPEVAKEFNLKDSDVKRVGVIAQEVEQLLPDAVHNEGDYMRVDENRIFFESAAAVQELHKLTGNLECKIDEVEKIATKCNRLREKLKRVDSFLSLSSAGTQRHARPAGPGSALSVATTTADSGMGDGKYANYFDKLKNRRNSRQTCSCTRVYNSGLCQNRALQFTIVCLVAIMATCLVAMASLYILDWHYRHEQSKSLQLPVFNRSGVGYFEIPNDPHDDATAIPVWFSGDTPNPIHAQCVSLDCPVHCCTNDEEPIFRVFDKSGNAVDVKDYYKISKDDVIGIATGQKKTTAKSANDSALNDTSGRSRRDAGALPDVRVVLPSLNHTTLGHDRYCVGDSCGDPHAGRYEYLIPVSKYMPHIPLDIQIDVPEDKAVDLCKERTKLELQCDGMGSAEAESSGVLPHAVQAHSAQQRQFNAWELPIGSHLKSSFQFRIAFSSPCDLPESEAGVSFTEVTLTFFRACNFDE